MKTIRGMHPPLLPFNTLTICFMNGYPVRAFNSNSYSYHINKDTIFRFVS